MARIFYWLAGITIALILAVGCSVFLLENTAVINAKQSSVASAAKAIALNLSGRISVLNSVLDKMAQDSQVIAAIDSANPALIMATAQRLEAFLPEIMKLRLLTPDNYTVDDKAVPKMGFADLDMVRETFTKHQPPGIQGDKGNDRHLALARQIIKNNQVIGVILASFDDDIILRNLRLSSMQDVYVELKQDKLALGSAGTKSEDGLMASEPIKISQTGWELVYQHENNPAGGNGLMMSAIIAIAIFLVLLCFFIGYRILSDMMAKDLQTLTKAFKDVMTHTSFSSYPVQLPEINMVIATLMQFKRVIEDHHKYEEIDQGGQEINILVSDEEDFNLDDFLGENNHLKL